MLCFYLFRFLLPLPRCLYPMALVGNRTQQSFLLSSLFVAEMDPKAWHDIYRVLAHSDTDLILLMMI